MGKTLYVNSVLDNDFKTLINEKVHSLKAKVTSKTLEKLSIKEVLKIADIVEETKPKSKMRLHKKQLLQYLDYFDDHKPEMLSQKEIDALMQKYVFQCNYLLESKGYIHKDLWIFSTVFGLVIDVILFFVGVSQYYYYLPLCMVVSFVRSYRRELKAKREGKLLNF